LAALALQLVSDTQARGQAASAEQVLERHGLARLGTEIWIPAAEQQLRAHLAGVDGLKDRVQTLSKQLSDRIEQNAATWRLLEQTQSRLKDAKTDAQKRALRQARDMYAAQCVKPQELGGQLDVQAMLIELTNQRDELLLALQSIRRLGEQMKAQYAVLADSPRVKAALAELGDARLGPAKDYEADLRRLPDYDRLVLTDAVPLFMQGSAARVSGIVEDRAALVFTWSPAESRVVITTNMAELAQLEVSQGKPARLRVAGRDVMATQIEISTLRFGRHVLRNVQACVLPPEAEDLGARLGPKVFAPLVAAPQAERLQLVIEELSP
jgi:hypothetical protein